eukprot:gene7417-biopygen18043
MNSSEPLSGEDGDDVAAGDVAACRAHASAGRAGRGRAHRPHTPLRWGAMRRPPWRALRRRHTAGGRELRGV